MGRKKIQIQQITDDRLKQVILFELTLQVTYTKRKKGFLKKAMEISVLCDIRMMVFMYNEAENRIV